MCDKVFNVIYLKSAWRDRKDNLVHDKYIEIMIMFLFHGF